MENFRKGPGKIPDIVGKVFGKLTVIAFSYSNPKSHWLCKCECGKEKIIRIDSLQKSLSCGCLSVERSTTHAMSRTSFNNVWRKMLIRCKNNKDPAYKDYGGRGIIVEWENFFEFKKDMYELYLEHIEKFGKYNTTLDRIDNNGNYSKNNCRWATRKEQANNRRSNVLITYEGITLNIKQWAKKMGISHKTLYTELYRGYDFENIAKYFIDEIRSNKDG